jgi:transcriptional regulator with XRE-family HTH domain
MRELREIIGQSQGEFAAMIGASKDAVASWETGRNRLSLPFARRIAAATGVEEGALRRGQGPLTTYEPFAGRRPYTAEAFEQYRQNRWGRSEEGGVRRQLAHCADALGLLFRAAARPGRGKPSRLPAVLNSFVQWCEGTRAAFKLARPIDEELAQRKRIDRFNRTYRQWREMQRTDPAMCRKLGFKDKPRKKESEYLRLKLETIPDWAPGLSMRAS